MMISLIPVVIFGFWAAASAIAFPIFLLDSPTGGLPPFVMFIAYSVVTWVSWKGYRFAGSSIEYDETGFAKIVGSRRDFTRWTDVSSVDVVGITGELRVTNGVGNSVVVRKGYTGNLDFIETMRRHVPEAIWSSALRFYEPGRPGAGGRPEAWGDPFNSAEARTPSGIRARRISMVIALIVGLLIFSPIIFIVIHG